MSNWCNYCIAIIVITIYLKPLLLMKFSEITAIAVSAHLIKFNSMFIERT